MFNGKLSRAFSVLGCAVALSGVCMLSGCAKSPNEAETGHQEHAGSGSYNVSSDTVVIDFVDDADPLNMFAASSSPAVLAPQGEVSGSTSANGVQENSCYSPASLYLAMAMLGEGAGESAQQQIADALKLQDGSKISEYTESAMRGLESGYDNYKLEVANSLWVREGYSAAEGYRESVEDHFDAEIKTVRFGTEEADKEMSEWVSDETGGLLSPSFKTSDAQISSLVNAIYFKDAWTEPFDASLTDSDTFHAQSGDVRTDFMHADEVSSEFIRGDGYSAATYPFSGGGEMTFFLPSEGVTPYELMDTEEKASALINPDDGAVEYVDVNWTVPKFKIESNFGNLKQDLEDLGVVDIFSGDAGAFANMIEPAGNFAISDIVQEAYMSLDENGVEAAASTSAVMEMSAIPDETTLVDFVLDRPFAYTVKAPNGMVIFMGIVENPA